MIYVTILFCLMCYYHKELIFKSFGIQRGFYLVDGGAVSRLAIREVSKFFPCISVLKGSRVFRSTEARWQLTPVRCDRNHTWYMFFGRMTIGLKLQSVKSFYVGISSNIQHPQLYLSFLTR